MAPETIFGDDSVGGVCLYSSKSDMFSFAVLLLYAVSLDLAKRWCEAAGKFNERYRNGVGILSIREKKEKVTDYLKNYVALHKSLIEELEKPSTTRGAEETKLYPLISRLLDRDPNNRPSAEETLRQLRELGSP